LGQTFSVRVQLPDQTIDAVDGTTINMPASGVGQTISASVVVTNRGNVPATLNFVQPSGSNDFTLSNVPDTPATITPGGTFGYNITYLASTSNRATGRVQFNATVNNAAINFGLNLVGVAPEFAYSYTAQGGNQTGLANGGTIRFPDTAVDATSIALVIVTNRGSYKGTFNSAVATGAEFATINVPLGNATVEAGAEVRFGVTFKPKALAASRGSLAVETADKKLSFNLEGAGTGASYTYEVVKGDVSTAVLPNQVVTLADANVGEKSSVVVRFRNTGNSEGRIAAITVSGTGFNLSEVPLLPLVIPANQTAAFTVNFQPTTPGPAQGRLRIGNDDFDLSASGLGSTVNYAFVINGVSNPVTNNGSVIFTPAAVGGSSRLRFSITNTGTSPTTVSSVGLAAPSTIFTLSGIPALPVNLAPNASTGFDIAFTPNALGTATSTLRVDNQTFTLSGAGNAPPPLPTMTFTSDPATSTQDPLAQPAISLTLASGYPLALSGTLTLAFNSEVFANDPAVQFATGGRTVNFTIPANSTRAIFPNNQNVIRVQTGSVAGSITVTPAITTTEGGIVLTPTTPPSLTLTVASGAPRILSVSLGGKTATTITVLVSGYATNRSVTSMRLVFTPTSGETVGTTDVTVPVEPSFLGYYQSAASAPYGSLFTVSIPLTLAGDIKNVTSVTDTIQSIAATLTNRVGTSNSVSLALR
jgi:hypothetical protein